MSMNERACSTLWFAERRAVDADGGALMAQAAQQGGDHVLVAEEVQPVVVVQIGRDNRRTATIPLLHELEEDVALLGAQGEIAHLVDAEERHAGEAVEELARGAIGERGVEVVEEV